MARTLAQLALSLLLSTSVLGAQVLVVDDDGGADVDFLDIQSAVAASADGDVVLVRTGSYGPFAIVGRGIAVLADNEANVSVAGSVTVEAVPSGSLAVLRGISTSTPSGHGVRIEGCAGAVRVEECSFVGLDAPTEYEDEMNFHGALVIESDDVLFARSTLRGGEGSNVGFFGFPESGADAVYAARSTVTVAQCQLFGGDAADAPVDDTYNGGAGGDGVEVWDSALWLIGSLARAGAGGSGDYDYDLFYGEVCGSGGDGGSGVHLATYSPRAPFTAVPRASRAVVRDFQVQVGLGGDTVCGLEGATGQVLLADSNAQHLIEESVGSARSTYSSSPVRANSNARVYATGEPGDAFVLLLGPAVAPVELPGFLLPLTLGAPLLVLPLGTVPSDGALQVTFLLPPFPAGFGATRPLQGAYVTPESLVELAPFGTVTFLGPN